MKKLLGMCCALLIGGFEVASTAEAQSPSPTPRVSSRGFCGSSTVSRRQTETLRAQERCTRVGPVVTDLEARKARKDADDDAKLAAYAVRIGPVAAACAQSYVNGDTAAQCGGLSDKDLGRAELWVQSYINTQTRKIYRAADFDADVEQLTRYCAISQEITAAFNWRSQVCAGRQP